MQIFVYEHLTGGGQLDSSEPVGESASLFVEGWTMISALLDDLRRIPGVQVTTLRDHRLDCRSQPNVRVLPMADAHVALAEFVRQAALADWTWVIAPEMNGMLADYCRLVEGVGGRLLGPCADQVQIASDKHLTAVVLDELGIRTPAGRVLAGSDPWPSDLDYPVVLKPCDGAGSLDVQCYSVAPSTETWRGGQERWRVEHYCPGLAASVAVLCGPGGSLPLAPCEQRLSDDGRLRYCGGRLPLQPHLAERARSLALRVVDGLRIHCGYVGVDLVLGDDPSGNDDVVIEVNPRLTTSYVGLRAASWNNLAAAVLDLAAGEAVNVVFDPTALEFDVQGHITRSSSRPRR